MGKQQSGLGQGREGGQQRQQGQQNRQGEQGQQNQRGERQQSQLGGHRDFAHRMENEGREQNREQRDTLREQGGQNVHGEGNYAATRQYDDATKQYVESGRVEGAARAAAPKSHDEAREMEAAEAKGKSRAKGEDPALNRPASPDAPRPGHEEE
jgi:hypothetical protein